ncbi:MAG: YfbM family protein [Clostridiales bacterium]|jgi:hypothetical protein|nr:YfbM family protein [Clostridiales bacterium]
MDLQQFAAEILKRTLAVNAAKSEGAERLQAAPSSFISENAQAFIKQGLSMQNSHDALRVAVEDVSPITFAPDDDSNSQNRGETMTPPIKASTFFVPLDESIISAFSSGKLDGKALMAQIGARTGIAALDDLAGLELVLTDFGKSPASSSAIGGGEIVAGSGGEAFIPECLAVSEPGGGYHICEPMVFKNAEEVKAIAAMLMGIDEKAFRKKADIKKLIKSGWLAGCDRRSAKKEADYIKTTLLAQFAMLRTPYLQAAAHKNGVAIFVGCKDDEAPNDPSPSVETGEKCT